jgi:hypothetical protein
MSSSLGKMRIGFLNNQIDERGTTWATFLYAKYASQFLGYSTAMYYPSTSYEWMLRPKWKRRISSLMPMLSSRAKLKSKKGYNQRMADIITQGGVEIIETNLDADFSHLDALYHMKSGENDGFLPRGTQYWVHAVSNASQPHGNRYAAISEWLGKHYGAPFVPYIIEVADETQTMRQELGIPADAVVLGRFGGTNTFDLPWVWEVIDDCVKRIKNVYFLFANTDMKRQHKQIISLPPIYFPHEKRKFINSCDVMLHAREFGETFGIACGEFALCGKPVLTYGKSFELSHIQMLRHPLLYNDPKELTDLIARVASGELPKEDGGAYQNCTPEKVMQIFDRQFVR